MKIDFVLNGTPTQVEVRPDEWFLHTLRERCGVTSLKDGCSPQGQCGCCVALVNGQAKSTCAMPAKVANGKTIVTLDGLPAAEREEIAACFAATAGLQCGFCIPGIAIRAKAITDREAAPTREAIAQALDLHLCRCTGYVKIIDAVAAAARGDDFDLTVTAPSAVSAAFTRASGCPTRPSVHGGGIGAPRFTAARSCTASMIFT